jgi:hypothetical protein
MGAASPENLIIGFIRVFLRSAWLKCGVRWEARRAEEDLSVPGEVRKIPAVTDSC